MSNTIKLLDKYEQTCSIATDMAAAKSLGLGRSAISAWRHGHRHAEADAIEKMCDAIGEPLARWLPLIEAERARSPGARRAWLRLAQVAAGVALTVGLTPAHSAPVSTGHNPVGTVYYVK